MIEKNTTKDTRCRTIDAIYCRRVVGTTFVVCGATFFVQLKKLTVTLTDDYSF